MDPEELKRRNLVSSKWDRGAASLVNDICDDYRTPRDWQEPAFNHLKDHSFLIVNAPTGSGKSWLMCLLSSYKMQKDSALKCIIAVPQTIIAPGFSNEKIQMHDGTKLHWSPLNNLCKEHAETGPVRRLLEWLEKDDYESLNDRALLCTHATLVRAYKKLKAEKRLELFKRVLLWVDEAHHISIETEGLANGIGELVAFLFGNKNLSAQIGLTTATLFRGDRQPLISPSMMADFEKYELPLDEYLKTMKHLKSFNYDFVLCGHDYTKAVGSIIKQCQRKDIMWIPHTVSQHSLGDKHLEVLNIIKEYQSVVNGDIVSEDNGITVLRSGVGEFKILNLIDEKIRVTQKKFIHSEKMACPNSLDAIIAMGMFKEGANWIHANRGIIVGSRSSLVDILQMLGRLLRDAEGKEHAELIHLLPFSLDQTDDNFGGNLNSFVKAVLISLLLEELIQPVSIRSPKKESAVSESKDSEIQSSSRLTSLIPDPSMMHSLGEESVRCMLAAKDEKGAINYERYLDGMNSVFDDYNVPENRELVAKKFWNLHCRKTFKMQGVNVEDVDFEIIKAANPLEWMLRYTSDACNINTLDRLREALRDANEKRWNKSFELLKAHFEKTQDSSIPEQLVIDGVNLFYWATVQRKAFKKGKMPGERQQKLESLSLWYWNYSDSRDEDGKIALMSFISNKKHSRVPTTHMENGFRLGVWLNQKKIAHQDGELSKEEIDFFESLAGWTWSLGHDQAWEYGFFILEKFVRVHGHARPPSGCKFDEFEIGTWVKTQRSAYADGRFPKGKAEKLERLPGWSWRVLDDRNQQGFDAFDSFVKREGHALVTAHDVENEFPLGKWVTLKRLAYSNPNVRNKITQEEIQKLESYPWWFWNGDDGRWERGKHFLLRFIAREGHSRVKASHVEEGFALGRWIGIWRHQYNKNVLSREKIDFFASLSEWSWNITEDRWHEGFDILKRYVQREGHAYVPSKHQEGNFKLGVWVRTQKYSYLKQSYGRKLSQEKVQLLESLPGWLWDNRLDESWNAGYEFLKKFAKLNRHGNVPARYVLDGYNLGTWVSGQKHAFGKGKLPPAKVRLLEMIIGWMWNAKEIRWEHAYDLLLKFHSREGTANVGYNHIEEGFNLGTWVQTQRKAYRADKIEQERIDKLDKLKGWSWGDTRPKRGN
jgi:superfamily II DNA or RNA helicase